MSENMIIRSLALFIVVLIIVVSCAGVESGRLDHEFEVQCKNSGGTMVIGRNHSRTCVSTIVIKD